MKDDPRVHAFRQALNKWKQTTFFEKLVNETDKSSIDRRVTEAHSMYDKLMARLQILEENDKTNIQEEDQVVNSLINTLGPPNTWTEGLLDNIRSVLITDLFEYPLTFNVKLIEQFKKESDFPTF